MHLTFKEQEPFYLDAIKSLGCQQQDIKRVSEFDIACKCPVCGDSRYGNKKRLHFYQNSDVQNVNCFNGDCSVKNMTLYTFLKNYTPRIFNEYRSYSKRFYLNTINKPKELETIKGNFDWLDIDSIDTNDVSNFILNFEPMDPIKDLQKIEEFLKADKSRVQQLKELLDF